MRSMPAPEPASRTATRPRCRPLRPDETAAAARGHRHALPHGFFVHLGHRFLTAYYATFQRSPYAIALAAEVDGERCGVLVGTLHNRAHYRWVVRHLGLSLALRALAAMLVRPRALSHFVRTRVRRYLRGVLRLGSEQAGPGGEAGGPVAVLEHVFVHENARGQGAGAALVDAFLEEARAAGATVAMLVTLAGDDGAGDFYRRGGWEHEGDRDDMDGRRISSYRLVLADR